MNIKPLFFSYLATGWLLAFGPVSLGQSPDELQSARRLRAEAAYLEMKGDVEEALKTYEASLNVIDDPAIVEKITELRAQLVGKGNPEEAPGPSTAPENIILPWQQEGGAAPEEPGIPPELTEEPPTPPAAAEPVRLPWEKEQTASPNLLEEPEVVEPKTPALESTHPKPAERLPWEDPPDAAPASETDKQIKRADGGDIEAMIALVERMMEGEPMPFENAKAVQWVGDAAKAGAAEAQMILGMFYFEGLLGLPEDSGQAFHWLRLSAEQGFEEAQAILGALYLMESDRQDFDMAHDWLNRAANQGNAYGQYFLGLQYSEGLGVPHNPGEAVRLWRLAAEQGDESAAFELGVAYENGRGVAPSPDLARQWYRKALEGGHPEAAESLEKMKASNGAPRTAQPAENLSVDEFLEDVDEVIKEFEQLGRELKNIFNE